MPLAAAPGVARFHSTHRLVSFNPSTNEKIAEISTATMSDYQKILTGAEKAFLSWREVPAPQRGEIIRQIGKLCEKKRMHWEVWFHWKWANQNKR